MEVFLKDLTSVLWLDVKLGDSKFYEHPKNIHLQGWSLIGLNRVER